MDTKINKIDNIFYIFLTLITFNVVSTFCLSVFSISFLNLKEGNPYALFIHLFIYLMDYSFIFSFLFSYLVLLFFLFMVLLIFNYTYHNKELKKLTFIIVFIFLLISLIDLIHDIKMIFSVI